MKSNRLMIMFVLAMLFIITPLLLAARPAPDPLLPPGKQAELDRQTAIEDEGRKRPHASKDPSLYPTPASLSPIEWPEGIFENGQSPFPSSIYVIENQWQGRRGNKFIQIWAGSLREDPTQGVVFMITLDENLKREKHEAVFPVPGRGGAVRVTEVRGDTVILTGRGNAATVRFNARSRAFEGK